jgi:hypothetical protein
MDLFLHEHERDVSSTEFNYLASSVSAVCVVQCSEVVWGVWVTLMIRICMFEGFDSARERESNTPEKQKK